MPEWESQVPGWDDADLDDDEVTIALVGGGAPAQTTLGALKANLDTRFTAQFAATSAEPPADPFYGQRWVDADTGGYYWWTGGEWAEIGVGSGVGEGGGGSMTAAEILTAIKTVDGAGSGLDADLLDGMSSAAFATAAQGVKADSALQAANIGVTVQGYDADLTALAAAGNSTVLAATTASFLTADETKLDGITAGATKEAVVSYTTGSESRTSGADVVFWVPANDTISPTLTVTNATGSDIVIRNIDTDLAAIGALTSAANKVAYSTGSGTWSLADFTATGRIIVASSSAQNAVANLRTAPATVTGTTDTLASGDDDTVILYTAAGAVTVTLANIAVGFEAVLVCLGAGGLSVAAGGMSFANSFTPKLTIAQGQSLYVKQTAASTWIVVGGTAT